MLRIKDFHSDYEDCIFYEGNNHYYIYEDGKNYLLVVEKMIDTDTGETKTEKYICSSLHTAIEQIELMENGEEV